MTSGPSREESGREEERELPSGPPRPHPGYGSRDSGSGNDRWSLLTGCVLAVLAGVLGAVAISTTTLVAGVIAALILVLALVVILQ
jgi:hypothetical protein